MVELVNALDQRSRPPPPLIIAKAFGTFIKSRLEKPGRLSRHQVQFLFRSFQYLLQGHYGSTKNTVRAASESGNIADALAVLSQSEYETDAMPLVNKFAKLLFQHFLDNWKTAASPNDHPDADVLCAYVSILSSSGSSQEALNVLETHREAIFHAAGPLPWAEVLLGMEREGNPRRATETWMSLCGNFLLDQNEHETLVLSMANGRCSASTMKAVYQSPIANRRKPTVMATAAAVKTAIFERDLRWASMTAGFLSSNVTAEAVDAIILLTAAQENSVEAVETRLEDLISNNPELGRTLTIRPINTLLRFARVTKKFDMIEGYASIARKWNLAPDAETYTLMMDARILMRDLDSALAVFRQLDPEEAFHYLSPGNMNQLIRHLCRPGASESDYDMLLFFIERTMQTGGLFKSGILGTICMQLLYRNDIEAASTLLRAHVDSYSSKELYFIGSGFARFICDRSQPIENVWEAYQLLNVAFPATPRADRAALMTEFFDRGRSDFACLVFGHMRQKDYPEARPDANSYALCFQGIAHSADATGLHLVHNMLKLDHQVRPTTEILEALMQAYAACEMPERAMEFFRDILHSEEGPSSRSLLIFFRVCESLPNGVQEATRMLEKLDSLDIQPDAATYNAYIGSLGGHCQVETAVDAMKCMESKTGERPSAVTYVLPFYSSFLPHLDSHTSTHRL